MQTSKNEAEVRVRVRRNPGRALRKLVLIFISVYLIYLTYNFVHDLVVARLAKVEMVSRGIVQADCSGTGNSRQGRDTGNCA